MGKKQTYIALLRGINVGGHHKVPMAELREEMGKMGFENVQTLLNSGNVIFKSSVKSAAKLEHEMGTRLEKHFGFPIPVLVRLGEEIQEFIDKDPFKNVKVTRDIRLYVSFLKETPDNVPDRLWTSEDNSYRILSILDKTICSVLDLSVTSTPKGMDSLEQRFGKNITTRNWNTLNKMANKIS